MNNRRWVLLAAWCGLLALGIFWVQSHLTVSADLRLFMPSPRTEEQRLLIQNIGESPASRLLLLAIDGDEPGEARGHFEALRRGAGIAPEFAFVANGAQPPPAIPEKLLAYRYLISDSFDAAPLDEPGSRPSSKIAPPTWRRRPPASSKNGCRAIPRSSCCTWRNAGSRAPSRTSVDGVWFAADGRRALLLVQTRAAAFDPDGQTQALAALQDQFAAGRAAGSRAKLTVSGTGYFSSVIRNRTQYEATWFGSFDTVGLITLLWLAYRRFVFTILGGLPLADGRARRPHRGQPDLRWRARHHHRVRLHADRRGAGLSHPPVQPPQAR